MKMIKVLHHAIFVLQLYFFLAAPLTYIVNVFLSEIYLFLKHFYESLH